MVQLASSKFIYSLAPPPGNYYTHYISIYYVTWTEYNNYNMHPCIPQSCQLIRMHQPILTVTYQNAHPDSTTVNPPNKAHIRDNIKSAVVSLVERLSSSWRFKLAIGKPNTLYSSLLKLYPYLRGSTIGGFTVHCRHFLIDSTCYMISSDLTKILLTCSQLNLISIPQFLNIKIIVQAQYYSLWFFRYSKCFSVTIYITTSIIHYCQGHGF